MAAMDMRQSRFGSSMSGTQPAIEPSLADTLPVIDFNFNELRERMAQFTARFDDFIERGRKRVLEERNAFRMNVADIEDQKRQRKQAISESESKSSNHAQILAKEAQEKEEMQDAISSLTAQREDHLTQRDQTKAEIAAIQATVRQRREAQAAHQRSLDAQARHNAPELRFWETCLGLQMEGTGVDDQLRFIFINLDERDLDRQCWFELQMGGREWEVVATKPRLDRDNVSAVQAKFNETRQLGDLFKGMRKLLAETVRT